MVEERELPNLCHTVKSASALGAGHISHAAMSWQGYVDYQLIGTGMVNKACIIGLNGAVWAQSAGFTVRHAAAAAPACSVLAS